MPNSLAAQFSQYGIVAGSNVSRAANNTMKKNFGVVSYKETMPVKRVLQNPRHFVNEKYVDITLSKFGMEVLLSNTILWIWSLEWTVNNDDLVRWTHSTRFKGPPIVKVFCVLAGIFNSLAAFFVLCTFLIHSPGRRKDTGSSILLTLT